MLVLDGTTDLPHTHNAKRALAIMGLVVAAAAFGILPISVSAIVGLGLMIVTGCLNWRDATTALSISQWRVVKIAMMKQAEVNSDTRLGALTRPRLLWVPVDLEDTAVQILATEHDPGSANYNVNVDATGNEREARLARARTRVICVPFWTDTNNWDTLRAPQQGDEPARAAHRQYPRVPSWG